MTVSGIERPERNVNGSQDVFDLREFPLLNVFPQNETVSFATFSTLLFHFFYL